MLSSLFILAVVAQGVVSQSTTVNPADACLAIESDVATCWSNTNLPVTGTAVASCICADGSGGVNTDFDDVIPICYPYAATASPVLGSAVAAFSGYCAKYAVGAGTGLAGATTNGPTSTGPVTVATGLAAECETIGEGVGQCFTNTQLAFTAPAIATCLCSDSTDANFGATLDGAVSTCYSYYKSISADATIQDAFSALQGYCGSYYSAGGAINTGAGSALSTAATSVQSVVASQASNSEDNTSLVGVLPSQTSISSSVISALGGVTSAAGSASASSVSNAASALTSAKSTTSSSGSSGGTVGGKSESSIFSINVGTILFTASASILILALAL